MKKTIALTGANGNMGRETLSELMKSDAVEKVKILLLPNAKGVSFGNKSKLRYGKKLEIIYGNIADMSACVNLVWGADYVVNMAAVIPPLADKKPDLAYKCNCTGAQNIVNAVSRIKEKQPKLIHISTVAVYGHRNYLHPWGRVGDPLLTSAYDCYASSKVKGERYVLESKLENWAILRQTGILHNKIFDDNMSDGLMFHTCLNVPLEWVSARDSGVLIRRIVERDSENEVPYFWKKCYNIGGPAENRITGYDTFEGGFGIIGGSAEKFMKPAWHSIRNFHGLWFSDGEQLNEMFDYQRDTVSQFWNELLKTHGYFRLGKLLPAKLIRKMTVEKLLGDPNAPKRWIESNDSARLKAFFGSLDNIRCLDESWENYPVLAKGQIADGEIDYDALRDISNVEKLGYKLDHGYDESKPISELGIEDMRQAAAFRGGECLSEDMQKGDMYTKLLWKCHDGHVFEAAPYTVLGAGHWCPECCEAEPWDFDRQSKFSPFFAQVWYDTHAREENCVYFYDSKGNAGYKYFEV